MSDERGELKRFDTWLTDTSEIAALVLRQWLVPVEGSGAVIFPATYAKPERMRDEDWIGYNIDRFEDGTTVCQVDSVGSQANRMETLFLSERYRVLVPRVTVKATVNGLERHVNLLEAGHRAADAIVRYSSLAGDLEAAFRALRDDGNAEPLAKIAPTSLVFGAWDSRGTQVKLPRVVRSVIRAYDVRPLHRSAQYIPPLDYVGEGLLEPPEGKPQQDAMSELGLSHAPAPWTHGGILVRGEIRREATLNLAALRSLGAGRGRDGLPLRRYILGLSLVAFTAPQDTFLREGCQLVPDPDRSAEWNVVRHDGSREPQGLTPEQAVQYAERAASEFGVGPDREAVFDAAGARQALGQTREERRRARRSRGRSGEGESET
jgi:CRISPR-associated protein Csb1